MAILVEHIDLPFLSFGDIGFKRSKGMGMRR